MDEYTYQDLLKVGKSEGDRLDFVRSAITVHKGSWLYNHALIAEDYDRQHNRTIMQYQKVLYTLSGKAVPDNFSANYKMPSNFFNRFITQENQYLLGNGPTWQNDDTAEKLGKDFDQRLQELGHNALVHGVSFGFFNLDHLQVFTLLEFVPLYDEENGALMAGIRFWQVADEKPLRATLYEIDGYTDYLWDNEGTGKVLHKKRKYVLKLVSSPVDGTKIFDGENYPAFPIVPLWANSKHQNELEGRRAKIDAYDLIESGFANDLDDASQIYWTLENAGGMDDVDLAEFVQRMKTVKAAVMDNEGAKAEAHTIDVPYAAREAVLTRLRADLYEDFMALDTKNIAGGAVTATQIMAAYEPLNNKTDEFEYCVDDFLNGIFVVAGITDEDPTFTRSQIVNAQENVQTLLQAAQYLPEDYVTEKILNYLGDGDRVENIMQEKDEDDMSRMTGGEEEEADEEGTGVEDLIANLESQLDDLDAQLAELESTGSDEGDEDEEDEEEGK